MFTQKSYASLLAAPRLRRLIPFIMAMALAGCAATTPPDSTATGATTVTPLTLYTPLAATERRSPNFGARRPNFVILHHTGDNTAEDALRTLTTPRLQVSAHYLIGRDGTLYYLVDELARAWHAGESYWGGTTDLNSISIGIELDNNGFEPFDEPMLNTLVKLLADLKQRYKIPTANFIGHGDIIPGRKVDPSRYFPWKRLADAGFGLWCEPPYYNLVPAGASDALLLSALGYDVTNLRATLAAFKRHYRGVDDDTPLSDDDRALLQCLIDGKRTP